MYNNPYIQPQYNRYQPMEQNQQPVPNQYMQQIQQPNYMPQYTNQLQQRIGLQGKIVDSLDVVKATDVPLDYSISYFPLSDSSAIITKRIKNDGTTEILTYKPVSDEVKEEIKPDYVAKSDLKAILGEINQETIETITEEIKGLKNEIKGFKTKERK